MQILIIYLIYFIINYCSQMPGGSTNAQLNNKNLMNYILLAFVFGNCILCVFLWTENCRLDGQIKQMKNVMEKYDSMFSTMKNRTKIDVEQLERQRGQLSQIVEQITVKTQKLQKKISLLQTILQKIVINKLKFQFGFHDDNQTKQSIIQQAKQTMADITQQLKQKVSALNKQYQITDKLQVIQDRLSDTAEGFKNGAVDSTVYLKQKLTQTSEQLQQKLKQKGQQLKQLWNSLF